MYYSKPDALLRCSNCGVARTECFEDFELTYKANGKVAWLCKDCNKYKFLFRGKAEGTDLAMIIAPGRSDSEDCMVYTKDLYI